MTQSARAETGRQGQPDSADHDDPVILPIGERWQAGSAARRNASHEAPPVAEAGRAGSPPQHDADSGDWASSRRERIARRSNDYYQERARLKSRQNRRTLRVALFVCAMLILAAAALMAPLVLGERITGYLDALNWQGKQVSEADLSGSGSVYMLPAPQPREPAPPPAVAQQAAVLNGKAVAAIDAVSNRQPEAAATEIIQPAGEQTAMADVGLLDPKPSEAVEVAVQGHDTATDQVEPQSEAATVPDAATTVTAPAPVARQNSAPGAAQTAEQRVAALDPAPARTEDAAASPATSTSDPDAMTAAEARALLERGDQFMQLGDIVSARALYVLALDADKESAALRLGSTFDPLMYRRIGVQGLKPDAKVALEWYLKAAEAGNADARRAYDALKRHAGQ